ncbi:3-oxoadipyl-CoA thiolase [Aquipuribacter hungaricus]|uniref:Beta-ketoadipyl-CoA thiolase n=1 Tax=Aquipuribacter hungaricus TaxID=545624 RepID=A0ABV7WKJ5_9MICO
MSQAFLVDGVRTPVGRYGGALAAVRPDDMAAHVVSCLLDRHPSLDRAAVDEVVLGCANQSGEDNRDVARMAVLLAGLPETVPGITVNRLCASGADAVAVGMRQVRTGEADLVVVGGLESMSRAPFVMGKAEQAYARAPEVFDTTLGWRFVNARLQAAYGTEAMGETAENVAEDCGVSREDQDGFALRSQQRTAAAQAAGWYDGEVVPVEVPGRRGATTVVTTDEHPRAGTTAENLAALRPAFRDGGTVTAGNAAGINDGAAALLLASETAVERYGLQPLARVTGAASAGVAPRVMGLGPVPATQRLLGRAGLGIVDVDVVELNEAFASQALAVLRALGLPDDAEHVNPHGGAIALGHPLGMSGARLTLAAARALAARDARRALVTMCVGVGQGVSLLLER